MLDVRKICNHFKYLVLWHGYGPEENTWELFANLNNAIVTVLEFHHRLPKKPRPDSIVVGLVGGTVMNRSCA